MAILSKDVFDKIQKAYGDTYGLVIQEIEGNGIYPHHQSEKVPNLPMLVHARAYGLSESVRWGEPYQFFLVPNVICWVVPLAHRMDLLGGLVGGEVVANRDPYEQIETINHLAASGCPRSVAEEYVKKLPVWNVEQAQQAAEFLFECTYRESDLEPTLLYRNRRRAVQQRQIAEEIHRRKQGAQERTLFDEERTLLSLMKAGDQKGARRELNKTLGALFSHSADIRLIQAHVIEMMGYLVRSAVEDSPHMSSLISKNHEWMRSIIEAGDFETLANTVSDSLDDFMRNIYLHGHSRKNETVAQILDYLGENFHDHITLEILSKEVGLSTFRISHLVKETTGKTVLQHIHQLRIQEAQRLLEGSDMSCTDIAYEAGFGDQSYFIKQFRKWMGITPARYRKLYRSRQAARTAGPRPGAAGPKP